MWRGIAALFVVVFHTTAVYAARPPPATPGLLEGIGVWLIGVTRHLDAGVPMFFVISGYCISATADATRLRGDPIRDYFVRRVRRIFPPYWGAIVMQAVLMLAIDVLVLPGLLTGSVAPIERPWTFTPWQYLGNLTLTESWRHLVIGDSIAYVLGQAWTLCFEEQFYLVTGVLLVISRRHFFFGALVVTLALFPVRDLARRHGVAIDGVFLDGHWLMFASGIAVYYASRYASPKQRVAWLLLLVLGVGYAVGYGTKNLVTATVFAVIILILQPFDERASRLRVLRPLSTLGTLCYSLYLVHAPIARGVSQFLHDHGAGGTWATLLVAIPISVVASLLLARVFFHLVERRFLNRPRAVSER